MRTQILPQNGLPLGLQPSDAAVALSLRWTDDTTVTLDMRFILLMCLVYSHC